MIRQHWFFNAVLLSGLVLSLSATAGAQEKSVNPGINKSYQNPSVEQFLQRFERDGRDAYDHRREILKACRLSPGMTVADIGAGTGLFSRMFSEAVGPKGKVYAVDIAKNFVEHIERMARAEKRTNIVGVICKENDVNLPPNSVDLAYICDVYHHFEYPHKTMRSLHRALKPGGQIIVIDFIRIEGKSSKFVMGHVRAGQDVFTKEITKAGFKQVEEKKGMLKESYFLRFAKVPDAKE